jgi:hypothetical protein
MGIARIHGNADQARQYETAPPEVEWACCPGVVCGHASRNGAAADGRAVYRLSGFRHPAMTGSEVMVSVVGNVLVRLHNQQPLETRG